MKKKGTLVVLLHLAVCQAALASDAAKLTLPSGLNNPLILRYSELADAPAPGLVKEGLRATYAYGSVSPVGCGDFWCNPSVLRSIPDTVGEDLVVSRGTYELNGQQFNVIRFYITSSQGFVLGMIYDLDTGILLHHTADLASSFAPEDGVIVTRKHSGILTLCNLRQVNIPWTEGSVPSWAVPGRVLSYQGQHAFWLPQLPDRHPLSAPWVPS